MKKLIIYIYIYIERERERERKRDKLKNKLTQTEVFNVKESQRYNVSVLMNQHHWWILDEMQNQKDILYTEGKG